MEVVRAKDTRTKTMSRSTRMRRCQGRLPSQPKPLCQKDFGGLVVWHCFPSMTHAASLFFLHTSSLYIRGGDLPLALFPCCYHYLAIVFSFPFCDGAYTTPDSLGIKKKKTCPPPPTCVFSSSPPQSLFFSRFFCMCVLGFVS